MTVAPSLIAAPVAWLAAKLAGARNWLHIQDFEVEAAFATGLLDSSTAVARWARRCERGVIGLFDRVSSISPEMCAKLKTLGLGEDRIVEFRNWADIAAIRPLKTMSPYREEWGIDTPHVALYSGNIANKQGIGIVVEAARRLSHRTDLRFVVCGEGPNRINVESEAKGLGNIEFHDLQPVERLADLMGLATIHLLPQKADAADLVLPSKLTNMLASGRPILVTAKAGTGLARETQGCGVITQPEDASAFATGIELLIDDPIFYREASVAARDRAERVWNSAPIIDGFERQALALIAPG
jgi:colanic acid biosynthesis glycosyl transferase WcaI